MPQDREDDEMPVTFASACKLNLKAQSREKKVRQSSIVREMRLRDRYGITLPLAWILLQHYDFLPTFTRA